MFEWVPSATWPRGITCVRVYVRWGKTHLAFGWEAHMENQTTTLTFKDRVLLIVWRPEDYPKNPGDWHELYDFSPYEGDSYGRRMINSVLISAHNAYDRTAIRDMVRARPEADMMDKSTWNKSGLTVLGDSGGSQLYTGKVVYIDPKKNMEFFNKGVDIGFALDIPPRDVDQSSEKVLQACALAQLKSNEVYEDLRGPGLKLFNVMHGFSLDGARRYIDTVVGGGKYAHWDGWGIGSNNFLEAGLLRNCVLTLREAPWPKKVFSSLEEAKAGMAPWQKIESKVVNGNKVYRRPYQHLHLFAVSGPMRVPAYAWLGKYIDRFTVDSTYWLQGAKYNRYLALLPSGELKMFPMGRERTKEKYISAKVSPIPSAPLPCSCPVCYLIPSWDVFSLDARFKMFALLGWHNIWTVARMAEMWAQNAEEMTEQVYRDEAAYAVGSGIHYYIDFVEEMIHGNIDQVLGKRRIIFAHETGSSIGQVNSIMPGAKGEDAKDPSSMLGVSNILARDMPSLAETTLPNYLTKEEMSSIGLQWRETSTKKKLKRKVARKRYKYKPLKKEDFQKTVETFIAYLEDRQQAADLDSKFRELKGNKSRRAFCKANGIPLPKLVKVGEVVLVSDEDHHKQVDLKHKRQGSRYKRRKMKRSLKNAGKKNKP